MNESSDIQPDLVQDCYGELSDSVVLHFGYHAVDILQLDTVSVEFLLAISDRLMRSNH